MNHSYRLIWNSTLRLWQVAHERVKTRGKSQGQKTGIAASTWRVRALAAALFAATTTAWANPVDPTVKSGTASFATNGNTLSVTNSNGAIINWKSFSINAGETTRFIQSSASSSVLNRVTGGDVSRIYGTLSSNGQVWLINNAGILIGNTGIIDTARFVASTLAVRDADFLAGRFKFEATPGFANSSVVNQGLIKSPSGGSVYLIGGQVTNAGEINTPQGQVLLAAGNTVSLADSGTPGVTVKITGDQNQAANLGRIIAEAGRIGMAGVLVKNAGGVSASSAVEDGGKIYLVATKSMTLTDESTISADGQRKGGEVVAIVKDDKGISGQLTACGSITAKGDGSRGSGGFVETSAAKVKLNGLRVNTGGGEWLIDPYDIVIAASGGDVSNANLSSNLNNNSVTIATSNGALATRNVTGLGNISVNGDVAWSGNTTLTLAAANNIAINANINASGDSAGLNLFYGGSNATQGAAAGTDYSLASGKSVTLSRANASLNIGGQSYRLIHNAADLDNNFRGNAAAKVALGNNFDMTAWGSFDPLGNSTTAYTGQFHGLGHIISNLTINKPADDYVGLFGHTNGATLRDVSLVNANVTGCTSVGALVGWAENNTSISNVSATGKVVGVAIVGGVIGRAYNNVSISDAKANVQVKGYGNSVGGLVGKAQAYVTISNSSASGAVLGSYDRADLTANGWSPGTFGGLVGETYDHVTITQSHASGNVSAGLSVGGLVGVADNNTSIVLSYANGAVTANASAVYSSAAGGLVGYLSGGSCITSSSASGNVIGNGSRVGGLVGHANNYVAIANSNASGNVTSNGSDVGGLVGNVYCVSITNSRASGNVSGISNVGGLVGWASTNVSISNSSANSRQVTSSANYTGGLIGYADTVVISNSSASGNVNSNSSYAGGLVGLANNSAISDSSANVTVNVTGSGGYVGGLVGGISSGSISNGSAYGAVSGNTSVGGLIGTGSNVTLTGSSASGNVAGSGDDVGGLAGCMSGNSTIANSHAIGSVTGGGFHTGGLVGVAADGVCITDSYVNGSVSGGDIVGGLVGGAKGDISIIRSNASGNVTGASYVGGLVGMAQDNVSISNSNASGNVTGNSGYVGGLVGGASNSSIANSSASGNVTGYGDQVGGLAGGINGGSISNSSASGNVTGSSGSVGGLVGWMTGNISNGRANGSVEGGDAGDMVGGLAGYVDGSISNSSASGNVTGHGSIVGGLVGYMNGSVSRSNASGNVSTVGAVVGGLVGCMTGSISNSRASGNVTGDSGAMGGLVGLMTGNITNSSASGNVTSGGGSVGGLVGWMTGNILNSNATGNVTGSSDYSDNVGGLVGGMEAGGSISDSSAGGYAAVASAAGTADYLGSYVGYVAGDITITNSSAAGGAGADRLGHSNWLKLGGGNLTLLGTNSYADDLFVANSASTVFVGNGVTHGALGAGNVVTDGTLIFNSSAGQTVSGSISGAGSLIKNGAGILTLAGDNTYSGNTTINSGTLQIGNGSAGGSINNTAAIINNGTLVFNRTSSMVVTQVISGTGSLVKNNSGILPIDGFLTLTANNTYSGGTLVNGGKLQVSNGSSSGTLGSGAVVNNASLLINRSGSVNLSDLMGNVSGTGSFYAVAGGNFVLDRVVSQLGANSSASILAAAGNVTLAAGGALNMSASGFVVITSGNGANISALDAAITGANNNSAASRRVVFNASVGAGNTGSRSYIIAAPAAASVNNLTASKTYDGNSNAAAVLNTSNARVNFGAGLNATGVSLTAASATFNTSHAGNASVDVSFNNSAAVNFSMGGVNWNVAGATLANATGTGSITQRNLVVALNNVTKVYDGSNAARAAGGAGAAMNGSSGLIAGDSISNVTGNGTYNSKHVIEANTATFTNANLTATLTTGNGSLASDYNISYTQPVAATITKANATVSGCISASSKVYDGSNVAVVCASGVTVSGVNGETLGIDVANATGVFNSTHVGTGRAVSLSNVNISNGTSGNIGWASDYSATVNTTGVTANITARNLTVTAVQQSKTYDGTLNVSNASGWNANGLVAGETLANVSLTYNDKNAGTGNKTITVNNAVAGANTSLSDYNISYVSNITSSIARANLTVAAVQQSKVYDGTLNVSNTSGWNASGLVAGETLANVSLTYADKNAGAGNKTINASNAVAGANTSLSNYNVSYFGNNISTIDRANLTVAAVQQRKVYDGTLNVSNASGWNASGLAAGETLATVTLTYADKNAGAGNKTINASNAVAGANTSLSNYNVSYFGNNISTIDRANLTVAAVQQSKVYDGTLNVSNTSAWNANGLVAGEALASVALAYGDIHAGANKTINASGAVAGANTSLSNYNISYVANSTGVITQRNLIVALNNVTKVYDGSNAARAAGGVGNALNGSSGLIAGDSISNVTGNGTYNSKHVIEANTATFTNANLTANLTTGSGSLASDYNISYTQPVAATITKANATVSGCISASNKVYDGSNVAVVCASGVTVSGVNGETLGIDTANATGVFNSTHVGTGRAVSLSNVNISNGTSGNIGWASDYNGMVSTAGVTANITRRDVAVTLNNVSKVYDSTTVAFANGAVFAAQSGDTGIVSGDSASLGAGRGLYDHANAAGAAAATSAKFDNANLTYCVSGGGAASDYNFILANQGNTSGSISRANLTVALAVSQVAQGANFTPVFSYAALMGADTAASQGITPQATLNTSAPGSYNVTPSGPAVTDNYLVSYQPSVVTVLPASNTSSAPVQPPQQTTQQTAVNLDRISDQVQSAILVPPVTTSSKPAVSVDAGSATGSGGATSTSAAVAGAGASNASAPASANASASGALASGESSDKTKGDAASGEGKADEKSAAKNAPATGTTAASSAASAAAATTAKAAATDSGAPKTPTFTALKLDAVPKAQLAAVAAERHEYKTELFGQALAALDKNPQAADLPKCSAFSGDACVPAERRKPTVNLPAPRVPAQAALPQIGRKLALMIGVNDYADKKIPQLDSAVPDAAAVGEVLGDKLGYSVRVAPNATRAEIIKSFNRLARSVGENDSVVVYYAGHGYLSENTGKGYWLPSDAQASSPDKWINNDDVVKLLGAIPAKQVMLVSDSCYSGALTKEAKVTPKGTPQQMLRQRSVTVMSSGGEEPVSDEGKEGHSIFAWNLMQSLKSTSAVESASQAFATVSREVSKDYPQTPHYGAATSAGYEAGGDFLLETRSYK